MLVSRAARSILFASLSFVISAVAVPKIAHCADDLKILSFRRTHVDFWDVSNEVCSVETGSLNAVRLKSATRATICLAGDVGGTRIAPENRTPISVPTRVRPDDGYLEIWVGEGSARLSFFIDPADVDTSDSVKREDLPPCAALTEDNTGFSSVRGWGEGKPRCK